MNKGLLDDVPLRNKERDEAWEAFIKRKDVKKLFLYDKEFSFPLNGAYYDLWSICWAKAWDKGFHAGIKIDALEVALIQTIGTLKWCEDLLRIAGHDEAVSDVQDCIMLLRKAQENG